MASHRSFLVLGLTLALVAGVSCSTGENAPTEPMVEQADVQSSQLLGGLLGGEGPLEGLGGTLGAVVGEVVGLTDLLTCSPQRYASTRKVVGPRGGEIKVGAHVLFIPRGALSKSVTITAEQVPGRVNSLRFSPEGLQFEKSASLTMSYSNCVVVLLPKRIAYTDEGLKVLELLPAVDIFGRKTVTAKIDHFSRYAVAY